jgi:hypothetical protein
LGVSKSLLALELLEQAGDWLSSDEIHARMGGDGCSPAHCLRTLELRGLIISKKVGQKKYWKISGKS